MNLKRALASIVVLSIFVTGCSTESIKEKTTISDEVTQQKTMTKVQNNVNEIMNKDYEYVINNMGDPYCTTYYIDMEDIDTLDGLNKTSDMRLIYPKYSIDNKLEGSALYIRLNEDKVVEVQTYEFSEYDIEDEATNNNADIIVDEYSEKSKLTLERIENIVFDDYKGKNEDEIYNIVGEIRPSIEAYDKTRNQNVKAYFLQDKNQNISRILTIFQNENKIEDIRIVQKSEVMNLLEEYLYEY